MGTVTFDLLIATDSAEYNLSKLTALKRSVSDASNNLEGLLDDGYRQVGSVVDKTRDVIFGHLWQLLLKDTFQAGEDNQGLAGIIIIDNSELNIACPLFDNGGLVLGVSDVAENIKRGYGEAAPFLGTECASFPASYWAQANLHAWFAWMRWATRARRLPSVSHLRGRSQQGCESIATRAHAHGRGATYFHL